MGSLSKRRPRAPRSGVLPAMINGLLDFARLGSRPRARTGAAGSSRREDLGGEASAPAESASPPNHASGDPRSAPMPGADPGAEADRAQAVCMPFATNQSARSLHTARFVKLADLLPEQRERAKKVKDRLEGMSKLWQTEIKEGLFKPRLKRQRRLKATELMEAAHAAENELIRKLGLRELRQPHLPELGTRAEAAPANGASGGWHSDFTPPLSKHSVLAGGDGRGHGVPLHRFQEGRGTGRWSWIRAVRGAIPSGGDGPCAGTGHGTGAGADTCVIFDAVRVVRGRGLFAD